MTSVQMRAVSFSIPSYFLSLGLLRGLGLMKYEDVRNLVLTMTMNYRGGSGVAVAT
jgi:hypothetical protein